MWEKGEGGGGFVESSRPRTAAVVRRRWPRVRARRGSVWDGAGVSGPGGGSAPRQGGNAIKAMIDKLQLPDDPLPDEPSLL